MDIDDNVDYEVDMKVDVDMIWPQKYKKNRKDQTNNNNLCSMKEKIIVEIFVFLPANVHLCNLNRKIDKNLSQSLIDIPARPTIWNTGWRSSKFTAPLLFHF